MFEEKDMHRYDDIINLPHHQSTVYSHMSMSDRAAQFAPFAALTGYDAAVEETAHLMEALNNLQSEQFENLADLYEYKANIGGAHHESCIRPFDQAVPQPE